MGNPLIASFILPYTGTYYIGVSGWPNTNYDPDRADSAANITAAGAGDYRLTIERNRLSSQVLQSQDSTTSIDTVVSASDLSPTPVTNRIYVAFENENNGFILRTTTDFQGNFSMLLAPNTPYRVYAYNPLRNNSDTFEIQTGTNGADLRLPLFQFGRFATNDTDHDGIADIGEIALGTSPTLYDTNQDRINDRAALQQNLDPLGSRSQVTGVLAALPLRGEAREIVIEGSTLNAGAQMAYLATGSYGLAIVNASQFTQPVVLGQLDLPGDATDIAVDTRLGIAAVASNAGGLHFVNVTDPQQPVLLRTLNLNASQVEVYESIAYVTVGSELRAYDLLTGEKLQAFGLGSNTLTGLAREGNVFYTMDSGRVLLALELVDGLLVTRGSLTMPAGGGKLFVGGGVAYVAAEDSFNGGFATANLSNLTSLTLISGVDGTNIAGRAIAVNGAGLAVAVGSPGNLGNLIQVLDVRDPGNTAAGLTQYTLSADPFSVTMGAGIAFVADGTAGLQVVNYRAFDTQGVPPTVSITTSAIDLAPQIPGLQVQEGTFLSIQPSVSDDVQVRNVELLVNGQVVANDVAFPFELSTFLPTIASNGSGTIALQARATDTGGNIALSNVITVNLVPDTLAPTIVSTNVPNGSVQGVQFRAITLDFSEPLDTTSVTANNFQLIGPGGTMVPIDIQFRRNNATIQFTYSVLSLGSYALVTHAVAVKDLAGNALGNSDSVNNFTISQYTDVWINTADGFWDVASNWDSGHVPGFNADVLINVPGNVTINYRSGTTQIHSLTSNNAFTLTGGTLTVERTVQVNNTFTFRGGTLAEATVLPGTGGQGITFTSFAGTLDGVTTSANLDLQTYNDEFGSAYGYVKNGLTLNDATIRLGNSTGNIAGTLVFAGTQTLGGNGTVLFGNDLSSGFLYASGTEPSTLTIGVGITLRGASGYLRGNFIGGTIINQGTIRADNSVGVGDYGYDSGYSGGSISSTSSAITTSGVSNAAPATVYQYSRTGSNFNYALSGLLPGASYIVRLHFAENTFSSAGSRRFNVSLNGTPVLSNFDIFAVAGGKNKAVVQQFTAVADNSGVITATFVGVTGVGQINGIEVLAGSASVLSVNCGVLAAGSFIIDRTTFTNQGSLQVNNGRSLFVSGFEGNANSISLTGSGSQLTVSGGNYVINQGLAVNAGQTLSLNGTWSNAAGSTLSVTNGMLNLGGLFTTAGLGTLQRTGGTVNLTGTLDNTGTTLALDASTGSWNLLGGTLKGGTYSATGGAALIFTTGNGTLDGVTANADLDLTAGAVTIRNSLTLGNTTVRLGNSTGSSAGTLYFDNTAVLGGNGMVLFGQSTSNGLRQATGFLGSFTLTIDEGITISAASGVLSDNSTGWAIINEGTILIDNSSGASNTGFTINPTAFTNQGTIEVRNGGILTLGGTWSNAAGSTLSVTNGTLNLGGSFITAGLGTLQRTGGTVNLTGTLDNTGTTLALDASTGSWNLLGGTLKGGTYSATGGAALVFTEEGVILDGVTANADLDLTSNSGAFASIHNGLTLNNSTIRLGNSIGNIAGALLFEGTQTLGGNGTVLLGRASGNTLYLGNSTLTIGPNITIRGISGGILPLFGTSALINQGIIEASTGGTLTVSNLQPNAGIITAAPGGLVAITGSFTQTASGVINVQIGGTGTSQFGRVNSTGAATLTGTLNVSFVSGFTPVAGNSFPIFTYASRTGTFSTINATGLPAGLTLTPQYNATNLTLMVGAALQATEAGAGGPPLTDADLVPIISAAQSYWGDPEALRSVRIQITDLDGALLGLAAGNLILIDRDAAGHGWFVDVTPLASEEFQLEVAANQLRAWNGSAAGRVDLLTVVLHELGHILGLDDVPAGLLPEELMSDVLAVGTRRLPSAAELDQVFALEKLMWTSEG